MFVVRYVALAALVVWLGGIIGVLLASAEATATVRAAHRAGLVSGGVVLLALFAMKFLGPPPHAFALRAAVVALMLAVGAYAGAAQSPDLARTLTGVNLVAGFGLLSFYVRE